MSVLVRALGVEYRELAGKLFLARDERQMFIYYNPDEWRFSLQHRHVSLSMYHPRHAAPPPSPRPAVSFQLRQAGGSTCMCGTLKRHEYRRIRDCWWCPRQKDLPRARIYGLSGVLVRHCRGHYQWPIVAQGGSPTTACFQEPNDIRRSCRSAKNHWVGIIQWASRRRHCISTSTTTQLPVLSVEPLSTVSHDMLSL